MNRSPLQHASAAELLGASHRSWSRSAGLLANETSPRQPKQLSRAFQSLRRCCEEERRPEASAGCRKLFVFASNPFGEIRTTLRQSVTEGIRAVLTLAAACSRTLSSTARSAVDQHQLKRLPPP